MGTGKAFCVHFPNTSLVSKLAIYANFFNRITVIIIFL